MGLGPMSVIPVTDVMKTQQVLKKEKDMNPKCCDRNGRLTIQTAAA